MVPATAVPSDEPRLETQRDSPEISPCWFSGNADCTMFTEGVSIAPTPRPMSSSPGANAHALGELFDEREEHGDPDDRGAESHQDDGALGVLLGESLRRE